MKTMPTTAMNFFRLFRDSGFGFGEQVEQKTFLPSALWHLKHIIFLQVEH